MRTSRFSRSQTGSQIVWVLNTIKDQQKWRRRQAIQQDFQILFIQCCQWVTAGDTALMAAFLNHLIQWLALAFVYAYFQLFCQRINAVYSMIMTLISNPDFRHTRNRRLKSCLHSM